MSLQPGQHLGPYEIEKLLGRGGMGEVYLARDTRLNRRVAIKVLPSEILPGSDLMRRFRREAGFAAALNHPNICTIHETGELDGQTYICMEYVEGITLNERIKQSRMELPEILDVAIQIADALDEARKKNIIHRDIKSVNILLSDRDRVKILDFGLAKQMRDSEQWSEQATEPYLSQTGDVRGTPAFMSPEQALGKKIDHRSDIFSFGVVLYQMLTGRLPFTGSSTTEVVDSILHKAPTPVTRFNDDVPVELVRVLNKMLEKDPEMRYQSVHEVWADLKRIKAETGEGKAFDRKKAWGYAATAAAILIAVAIGWIYFPRNEVKPSISQPAVAKKEQHSLAVLLFRYTGNDPSRNYLGILVTDGLIAGLQTVPGLAIAPYANVREIKESTPIKEIAGDLGVRWIIKGNVTVQGENTQVTTEVYSADGSRILNQKLIGSPVATLDLIKKSILSAIEVNTAPPKDIEQVRTPSMDAYKTYLDARNHEEGWDVEGNQEEAIRLYREALQIDPDFAAAHARLAMALVRQFHLLHHPSLLSSSSEEAKRALALDSDLPEALLAHGIVQLESGNSAEAKNAFARALSLAPGDDSACKNLATVYSSLGRNREAREMYQRSIDLRPNYWVNHYELGRFESQLGGDLKSAKLHLERAIELHAEGFAPLVMLGLVHYNLGNLEDAEISFRRSLERSPNRYAYNNLGLIHYYRGQYDLALRNWQTLLNEMPDRPVYQNNVGDALRQLKQLDQANAMYLKAISAFREALKLNRLDDDSRAGLGMALAGVGQCKEAFDQTREVLSRHADSPELTAYAAITVSRCGDYNWAKQIVLASIARDNLSMIQFDPDLEPVRRLPDVKQALSRVQQLTSSAGPQP
ncbi:protein kinase [bacterium]|nr:protein kinase [bacterium]MCI0605684.1 protein kinase [bacterium]